MIDCRLYISSWKKKLFFIFVNTLGTGISRKCCENSNVQKKNGKKWRNVLFNLTLSTFWLTKYFKKKCKVLKIPMYLLRLKMFRNTTLFFKHKKSFYGKLFDWPHFTDFIFLLEVWYIPIGGLCFHTSLTYYSFVCIIHICSIFVFIKVIHISLHHM